MDTEAVRTKTGGVERQRWRLGVTSEVHWQSKEGQWSRPVTAAHFTPEELWETVTGAARDDTRTVVVAHNLGYDLRIADAFAILTAMGWVIDKLTLSADHVGFDAVCGRRRLVFVDSTTVLPVSVERLGQLLEMAKPALPDDGDSDDAWLTRCLADVEILRTAYLVIPDALRSEDLGCWARTGTGIGWNTYTRRFLNDKVLVHCVDELRELEHGSIYGGRAEAWRWGKLARATWHEWDAELAYANVLADEVLPAYYLDRVTGVKLAHIERTYPSMRWLVEAEVATELPVLPLKDAHGSFYPVGTFRGWWWDCELLGAAQAGAAVKVIQAHRYRGEAFMATWANWVIDLCADDSTPSSRVLAVAAKHWQRAVVGRTAMRYGNWNEVGEAFLEGISYMQMIDYPTGDLGACFQAGGRRWETWSRSWWDQALPQVLAAVSAHCRVRLWGAMTTAGLDHLAYVDTDCVITDDEGHAALTAAKARGELYSLREKGTRTGLNIWAPRYVTSPNFTRIAGVPSDRRSLGRHKFASTAWERLPEALNAGNSAEVVIRKVISTLSLDDFHRDHLEGGRTAPYRVVDGVRVESTRAEGVA